MISADKNNQKGKVPYTNVSTGGAAKLGQSSLAEPSNISDCLLLGATYDPSMHGSEEYRAGELTALSDDLGDFLSSGAASLKDILGGQLPVESAEDESDIQVLAKQMMVLIRRQSADRQLVLLESFIESFEQEKTSLTSGVPALPCVGEGYPRYTEQDGDPLAFLGKIWGPWLTYFNETLDRDYLYLDQLGKLDAGLKDALYAKRRRILTKTGKTVSEIVPKKSVRIDRELAQADSERLKSAVRLYAIPHSRKARKS